MALIDDFKARFPEFSTAVVDQFLPLLEPVWPCYYGGSYDDDCDKEIILQMLAHLIVGESASSAAAVKDVASKSVGSVSVSYNSASSSSDTSLFWSTTKYGQRYLLLTNNNSGAYFV